MDAPRGVARLDEAVAAALVKAGYSGKDVTLVVAVSGGPDSSALLYSLHRLSIQHQLKVHVAHLNHDIRGAESDQDADFVQGLAKSLGLPFTIEKEDPLRYQRENRISSFEQVTREMRYRFLLRVARQQSSPAVAVGHTADDQAETVLEHILRGSGIHGLRGMTEVAPWPWPPASEGVSVFRPLLALTKTETVAYCQSLGKDFRKDSDNYSPQFTRNRVRHQLLPLLAKDYNPRITDSLVRLSNIAELQLDYLEGECDRLWPQVSTPHVESEGEIRLNRKELAHLHPALQRLLLRRAYSSVAGDTRRLRESHLKHLSEFLTGGQAGFSVNLPRGIWVHGTHNELVFSLSRDLRCPLPTLIGEYPVEFPQTSGASKLTTVGDWRITTHLVQIESLEGWDRNDELTALMSSDSAGTKLWVRSRRRGDRFQPLGMTDEKKLQDFFVDCRVPRQWRDDVPLLLSPQGIAWVVGYRIAEWAKVLPEHSTAWRITFSR